MGMERVQKHRRERLEAAAAKAGGKAALGRLLGYKDGAFVGQMLRGERPVTEETVLKLEAKAAFKGWFGEPTLGMRAGVDTAALLACFERIGAEMERADDALREMVAALVQRLARAPHEAHHLGELAQRLLASAETSAAPATEAAPPQRPRIWSREDDPRKRSVPVAVERRKPQVMNDLAIGNHARKPAGKRGTR